MCLVFGIGGMSSMQLRGFISLSSDLSRSSLRDVFDLGDWGGGRMG